MRPILDSNRAWRGQNQHPLVLAAEVWLAESQSPQRLLTGESLRSAQSRLAADWVQLNASERGKIQDLIAASEAQEGRRKEFALIRQMADLQREKYISELGWGVVFPAIASAETERLQEQGQIVEALRPLLEHRKAEATLKHPDLYRELIGPDGVRPGDTANTFLVRHKIGPGEVDPTRMPHYLLLVADPETIPFEVQYGLDRQFAVGRAHFQTVEEYRSYAEAVVRAETGTESRPRRVGFFAPQHPMDQTTNILVEQLVSPLMEGLEDRRPDWSIGGVIGDQATKARLGRILGGAETPALVFTASHSVLEGAVLCQDWPGLGAHRGEIPPDFYFAADDLSANADVFGVVVFSFGAPGGTPRLNDFYHQAFTERAPIADRASLAPLPCRLLGHPKGGALAFVGHVDRAWTHSFEWEKAGSATGVRTYAAAIERLLDGYPVGAALEPLRRRHAAIAEQLTQLLHQSDAGAPDPYTLARLWTATIDARNWIVVGDPAVRLMVSGLRPDMEGLKVLYRTERLRCDADGAAELGDLAVAEQGYRSALALSPWLGIDPEGQAREIAARGRLREARRCLRDGDLEAAGAALEEARGLHPSADFGSLADAIRSEADALIERARQLAAKGERDHALRLLYRVRELDPLLIQDPEALVLPLVGAYHRDEGRRLAREAGDVAAAIEHYSQALALDPGLSSELDPTRPLDPAEEARRFAAIHFVSQGESAAQQGDEGGAVTAFQRAVALDPTLDLDPSRRAAALMKRLLDSRSRGGAAKTRGSLDSATLPETGGSSGSMASTPRRASTSDLRSVSIPWGARSSSGAMPAGESAGKSGATVRTFQPPRESPRWASSRGWTPRTWHRRDGD